MWNESEAKSSVAPEETSSSPAHRRERELLLRVAASQTFQRSARLRDLLLDIGERSLTGCAAELLEHAIGMRVFGRPEDYNPADDNIVRASVRQLRMKLQEYFETEGKSEGIKLEIPKGGYLAVFSAKPPLPGPIAVEAKPVQPRLLLRVKWFIAALAGSAVVLTAAWLSLARTDTAKPAAYQGSAGEGHNLVALILEQSPGPVRFVLTDSALVLRNILTGVQASVEDYADGDSALDRERQPQTAEGRRFWDSLRGRQMTSLADVLVLSRLLQEMPAAGQRVEVKHSKFMTARDFKSGNFILTGSPTANPWAGLFEQGLNFRFVRETGLRNLHPAEGEPTSFMARPADHVDPARIAFLRNLSGAGFVFLLAGAHIEGTEGAGEFLLREDSTPLIMKTLGLRVGDRLPPFEIVLEISTLEGTARSAKIAAWRRHEN